jgi:hypothetical protein
MKKTLKYLPVLLMLVAMLWTAQTFAQGTPPPPPSGGHGQTGNSPPGGNAPIGGGLAIMLVLGAAYAGKKAYDFEAKK